MVFCADYIGGMFGIYFSETPPTSYAEMMAGDRSKFNAFFHAMLDEGVYFAPAAFEAGFVSAQHDDAVIDATIAAARKVFADASLSVVRRSRCPSPRPPAPAAWPCR